MPGTGAHESTLLRSLCAGRRSEGSDRMRVFFYIQHLLGIGHVFRALRIARALAADGARVDLVLGGAPLAGLDLDALGVTQLPAIRTGAGGFTDLVQEDGRPVDSAFKAMRRDR